MERPKLNKILAHSVFVVAGAFEFISNGSDDAVDAILARDEVLSNGDTLKRVVCCSVALTGPVARASKIVGEDLTFQLVGAIGNADEVVEDG